MTHTYDTAELGKCQARNKPGVAEAVPGGRMGV